MPALKYRDPNDNQFKYLVLGGGGGGGTTILSGTATPTSGDGALGDYYLDTDNRILYGPKGTVDVWPVALNGNITVSSTAPPSPVTGAVWIDTSA